MAEHWCKAKDGWAPGYSAGCAKCHPPRVDAKHVPIYRSVKDSTNPKVQEFLSTGDPSVFDR